MPDLTFSDTLVMLSNKSTPYVNDINNQPSSTNTYSNINNQPFMKSIINPT